MCFCDAERPWLGHEKAAWVIRMRARSGVGK